MAIFSYGKVEKNLVGGKPRLVSGFTSLGWFDSWYNNMENINLPTKFEYELE